jgi:hypothetical protein
MQPMINVVTCIDTRAETLLSRHFVVWAGRLDLHRERGSGGTYWKGMH